MNLPIDDNLHGLLVELAERPERTVLGTRVRRFQDLLRPDVEVLRPSAGMGVVEAKLLEAHREELAWLLLQASHAIFEARHVDTIAPRDAKGRPQRFDPDDLRVRRAALLAGRLMEAEPLGGIELLRRTVSTPSATDPSPFDLAITSLRLVPRAATRIWLGVFALYGGDPERCVELQHSALIHATSGFLSAYAWGNISVAQMAMSRYQDAVEAGRSATYFCPNIGRGPLTWLPAAIQGGRFQEVRFASMALAEVLSDDSQELEEQIEQLRHTRTNGAWQPSRQSSAVVAGRMALPSVAERILEVFD